MAGFAWSIKLGSPISTFSSLPSEKGRITDDVFGFLGETIQVDVIDFGDDFTKIIGVLFVNGGNSKEGIMQSDLEW